MSDNVDKRCYICKLDDIRIGRLLRCSDTSPAALLVCRKCGHACADDTGFEKAE
ncbi:MAG: hypothetical protein MI923_05560 [Phycisphaerales bacterium]|nr:hypothetical protein [Phycisphaerales bacterium]